MSIKPKWQRTLDLGTLIALSLVANYLAFLVRFEGLIPKRESTLMIQMLPWLVSIRLLTCFPFRLSDGNSQFISIRNLPNIVFRVTVGSFISYLLVHWVFNSAIYPRAIFPLDAVLLLWLIGTILSIQLIYHEAVSLRLSRQALSTRLFLMVSVLIATVCVVVVLIDVNRVKLPYDRSHPVIYDNDETIDVYTDDYLMALASAGDIKLVGLISSTSVAPYNKWVQPMDCETLLRGRANGVANARSSGLINLPDPVCGTIGHLRKPASGRIAHTLPLRSEGSRLIVNEASKATAAKPLVVVMGGALTVVADAYLLDKTIADKLVVAWLSGNDNMNGYNTYIDGWAAYIVLEKLKLVHFAVGRGAIPYVPKAKLLQLPDTNLRRWMTDKYLNLDLPGDYDFDAAPAISVMRSDYARKGKRVSFSHWTTMWNNEVPIFKDDPNGKTLVVTHTSGDVATEEWWRALMNPLAYTRSVVD